MMSQDNKSSQYFTRVQEDIPDIQTFLSRYYNRTIEGLNTLFNFISFSANFDSQVLESKELPASSTTRLYHTLKVTPKHRIITRQSGNSLLTDGAFTENYIELINNGANDVTATIIIFKE